MNMWTSTSSMYVQSVFQSRIRLPWHKQRYQEMYLTLQRVLLCPHDVDQGALQRMHVQAVIHPGPILRNRVEGCVNVCNTDGKQVVLWNYGMACTQSGAGNGILSELIALSRNRACLCRPSSALGHPWIPGILRQTGFWDTEFRPSGMLFVELSRVELTRQVC